MSADPSEKIRIACPQCGKQLMLPISALGKMGKCPGCQNMFPLQASPAAPRDSGTTAPPVVRKPPVVTAPGPAAATQGNSAADPFAGLSGFESGQPMAPLGQTPFGAPPASTQSPLGGPQQFGQQPLAGSPGLQQPDPSQWSNSSYDAQTATRPVKQSAKKTPGSDDATPLSQIGGGILMMIGAAVWFVLGMMANRFFIYPPVLFILGLVSLISGIVGLGKR